MTDILNQENINQLPTLLWQICHLLGKTAQTRVSISLDNKLRRLRTIRCKDSVPRRRKVYTVLGETKCLHALTAYSTGVGIAAGVTLLPTSMISTTAKETNATASKKRILILPVLGYEISFVTATARRSVYIRDHHQTGGLVSVSQV